MSGDLFRIFTQLDSSFTNLLTRILPLLAIGAIYSSRLFLSGCPKNTGEELENAYPEIRDVICNVHETHKKCYLLILVAGGSLMFLLHFANKVNLHIWKEPALVLLSILMIALALYDGFFAIKTNIFPTTTRYKSNSFFFDKDEEYRWVAQFQIVFALVLFLVAVILLVMSAEFTPYSH